MIYIIIIIIQVINFIYYIKGIKKEKSLFIYEKITNTKNISTIIVEKDKLDDNKKMTINVTKINKKTKKEKNML